MGLQSGGDLEVGGWGRRFQPSCVTVVFKTHLTIPRQFNEPLRRREIKYRSPAL